MSNNTNGRERFSMDNEWKFYLGDIPILPNNGHGEVYGFTKAGGTFGPAQANWDENNWKTVSIPHDWVTDFDFDPNERPNHGYKARGIGWYRKSFRINEEDKGKQILLSFDGICTHSTIYFNGSILERNFSAYNSFSVDISDRLFYGDRPNTLAIRVDASVFEGWWYEGAGIYRHAYLTKKSAVHIAHWGTWVNPQKVSDEKWNTLIETTIENSSYENQKFKLVSILLDPNENEVGRAQTEADCLGGEKNVIKQSLEITNPMLWDIDSPQLYSMVSEVYQDGILVDNEQTTYGYRTIKFCAETGFYLNDRPVKLMGTCNHQDHACVGVAVPDAIQEYRIRRLKEMGSNAYRCAHNNPAKEILDACDKLGMLVMDENRNFESTNDVIRQVESMVKRDRNHPCVIMYSIFNEEPLQGTPQGRNISKRLMHVVKRLDNTRAVVGALNGGVMEDEGTANMLDVAGINYQLGAFDKFHEKYPNQPVVASESASAFSTRGIYETDMDKHVFDSYDEHKAPWGATVRENWKAVNTRDYVMGTFVWTGFDYLGEPTPFLWPSVSTAFGIMDTCGFAKDAFYLHKACWTKEPMVHILPHWNWNGMEGKPIKVMTHTNCDEVELFLNGKSLGKKPTPIYEQASWDVPYESGILQMNGFINGDVVAQASVETTGEAVALKLEPDKEFIFGDCVDAMPINVLAIDEKGRFVPLANDKVTFKISGLASILGVGNGDPNSLEPYVSNQRSLFNGRCQAIIQSHVGIGEIEVIAEAQGLKSAIITIDVKEKMPPQAIESVFTQYLTNWRMTHELFAEKPDPNMAVLDSDMNTWEPIEVGSGTQAKFEDKNGYYALYRSTFSIPNREIEANFSLNFGSLLGYVEVYVDCEKLAEAEYRWPRQLEVKTDGIKPGEHTLTVLIKCISDRAGICQAVNIME